MKRMRRSIRKLLGAWPDAPADLALAVLVLVGVGVWWLVT